MKHKDKIITLTILLFILLSIFVSVFAREEDEPPLQVKMQVYEQILQKAKDEGVDTTEAENLMKEAMMTLSSGFANSAGAMVDVAVGKLLEGLSNVGWKDDDLVLMMTPGAEAKSTPPPSNSASSPTPYTSIDPTAAPYSSPIPYIEENNIPDEYESSVGGCTFPMVENIPVFWIKPEKHSALCWDRIESEPGIYDWEYSDRFYSQACQKNLNILVNIAGIPSWDSEETKSQVLNRLPANIDRYKEFIKSAVERYDGDEYKDSSEPTKINYFQLGDELDSTKNTYGEPQWIDTVENYAVLLRLTKKAIEDRNAKGKLILGSSSDLSAWGKKGELHPITKVPFEKDGWFVELLEALKNLEERETADDGITAYFDGLDFHHYGGTANQSVDVNLTYKDLDAGIELMKKRLYEYGYKNSSIWVTGNSIYTGTPVAYSPGEEKVRYIDVSEREQASYLVKSIIISIASGAEPVFWSSFIDNPPGGTLHYGAVDTFYSYSGLIRWDQTPKLSFYTYNLLSNALYKAKFNQEFTGLESGICGYAFVKERKPFYIFWNDNREEKTVRINGEVGKYYTVTHLITGQDGEIAKEDVRADGGIITFPLGQSPVIIEQK